MNCCVFLCIIIHIIWHTIWKKWNDRFVLNFRGADHKVLQTSVLLQQPRGDHNYHQQHHLCAACHIIIGHSAPKSWYVIQSPGGKKRNVLKYSWYQDFFSSFVCNFMVVTQVEYPGLSHQALDLGPNSWSLYLPNLCRGSGVKNKILSVDDSRCVIKPGNPQFSLGI